jgi:hypothetical protein
MNSPVKDKDYYLGQVASSPSPSRSNNRKKILHIGLVIIGLAGGQVLSRRIVCPNPVKNPEFYVSDFEVTLETGDKCLIVAAGNIVKAGEFAEAIE